ncbi:carboxypeptidase-like regulatory domain-containing protein [Snuella lapsa]|uniref:Carboxypeptidase-like regulatory domain-containing protein n=1 Tax=Snuella lapsa TaxID=870481 RepID=A0ABP6X5D4_9FLAO
MTPIHPHIYITLILLLPCSAPIFSQQVTITGKVEGKDNVENIHVINKTSQNFTITNANGEFQIETKLQDTLLFSSIQHKTRSIIIDKSIIQFRALRVNLEEHVNELDEVIVGKTLTGNLLYDIKNVDGKPPINFYDVGIPGYTGKPATQSERMLHEAGEFKPSMLLGLLGGSVPLNPIINGLSGRTKMLKNRVKLEEKEALMQRIKGRLSRDFFASNPLEEDLRMDFFYFCADDPNFIKHCKNQTNFNILMFLRRKYKQYQENLKSADN